MPPRHINYSIPQNIGYSLSWQDVPLSVAERYCELPIYRIDLSLEMTERYVYDDAMSVNEQCLGTEDGLIFPNPKYFEVIKNLDDVIKDSNYLITTDSGIRIPTRWLWDFNSGIRKDLAGSYSRKIVTTIPTTRGAKKIAESAMKKISEEFCFRTNGRYVLEAMETSFYIIVPKGEPLDAILYLKMSTDFVTELDLDTKKYLFKLFSNSSYGSLGFR